MTSKAQVVPFRRNAGAIFQGTAPQDGIRSNPETLSSSFPLDGRAVV